MRRECKIGLRWNKSTAAFPVHRPFSDCGRAERGQWRLPVNGRVASALCCWVDWRNNEPHRLVWFPLETAEWESDPHTALAPTNPICFTPLFLSVSERETASTRAFSGYVYSLWFIVNWKAGSSVALLKCPVWLPGHAPHSLSGIPFPLMSTLLLL